MPFKTTDIINMQSFMIYNLGEFNQNLKWTSFKCNKRINKKNITIGCHTHTILFQVEKNQHKHE